MNALFGIFATIADSYPKSCDQCGKDFTEGQLLHRECLRAKHGGTLPEGFGELITMFELDGDKSDKPA